MAAKSKSNQLHLTRVYEAPVEAVWDAWVDPEQVGKWWGPRGFTLTTFRKDVRTGGEWRYTMHGPDGTDYPNVTRFLEVEKHQRLVYDHGATDDKPPLFRVTVIFKTVSRGTQMDMTMQLASPEAAEETRRFIKKARGESTWDRLAEHLIKNQTGAEIFVIHRVFPKSIERMYSFWSEPDHVARWLPPTGATMRFLRAEVKEGGSSFYEMVHPGSPQKMYGRVTYRELHRPDRLVYVQQFCDENEKVIKPAFAPTWPESMLTTVELTVEGPEETRVLVRWQPEGKTSPEELRTFIQGRSGMTEGWTGSFDKLEEAISNAAGIAKRR